MPRKRPPFIVVGIDMPEHAKVDPLSDKAFRVLIKAWCYCARYKNDGHIAKAKWHMMATDKVRRELTDAGLVHLARNGDAIMHDYLEWQQSAEEIGHRKAGQIRGALETNHKLHHLGKGRFDPDCTLCPPPEPEEEERSTVRSSARSSARSTERLPNATPDAYPTLEVEVEGASNASRSSPAQSQATDAAHDAAQKAYEQVGKAGKFMAIKASAKWAMTARGLTPEQFIDAYVTVYRSGRPTTREALGQYIDGHQRNGTSSTRSAGGYLAAYQQMTTEPPAIGA